MGDDNSFAFSAVGIIIAIIAVVMALLIGAGLGIFLVVSGTVSIGQTIAKDADAIAQDATSDPLKIPSDVATLLSDVNLIAPGDQP